MRGGFESAARWNAHYAREAERNRDAAIRALRTLAESIREAFKPEEADAEGFWSVWYDWAHQHEAVRVPYDNAYHYGHGGGATSAIYHEFRRIVKRERLSTDDEILREDQRAAARNAEAFEGHGLKSQ